MRNIPDDNLAYPVLLTSIAGSGSGFLLNSTKAVYFVTAKHVLVHDSGNPVAQFINLRCQSKDPDSELFVKYEVDLLNAWENGLLLSHSVADIAAVELGKWAEKDGKQGMVLNGSSVRLIEYSNQEVITVNALSTTLDLKDVLISNDVYVYGYPSSLGLRESPQFDYERPLLRKGIVASTNRAQQTIILDCPVYYGNSGGPVVQLRRQADGIGLHVIGVVSQFIPYSEEWINQSNGLVHTEISNSGYSVAVAMDPVFEMLGIVREKQVDGN